MRLAAAKWYYCLVKFEALDNFAILLHNSLDNFFLAYIFQPKKCVRWITRQVIQRLSNSYATNLVSYATP